MKLSRNKKIILLTSGIGILTTSIVAPILLINNNENNNIVNQDKNEIQKKEEIEIKNEINVEKVIELLEAKKVSERIIILSSSARGKIIVNHQEKIISKLKELIGISDLKEIKIKILMDQDQNISTNKQKVIIKVSKGDNSEIVDSSKTYFVKRSLSEEEIVIINKIKTKIQNKDLTIPKNIRTFSDNEIFLAIKNQLQINNSTLNNDDLSKITDNIQHLKPGKKTSVILTINLPNDASDSIKVNVTKEKNIKLWTKNSTIVKNSNIHDGKFSSFIQDSSGNFWAMGGQIQRWDRFTHRPTKLQVLKRDGEQWEEDISTGLTKGSNIKNGTYGSIFEDDFGNIWNMGIKTKLQVLVKNQDGNFANSWTDNNEENGEKLLQGSKVNDGNGGTIFQDSFGNLWVMGNLSKLQVLLKNKDGSYASSWINDNTQEGLLKNSNISNCYQGTIFQDKFKNLWSMGHNSKLQVLKAKENGESYVEIGWVNDNKKGLLKNSAIRVGNRGKIFQDSIGNLWAMGKVSKLQVLKVNQNGNGYVETGWINDNTKGLLKGSNAVQGLGGIIFEDSFGNLWNTSYSKKPQVLKRRNELSYENSWINNNTQEGLLKNLKTHSHGLDTFWIFFQDSSQNLWAMGNQVNLQVLKVKLDGTGYVNSWTTNDELLKSSNIIYGGQGGLIFEDSSQNLWSIGTNRKLQVYDKILKKWKS